METAQDRRTGALRIRLGVGLVILSWMPFAQVAIWLMNLSGSAADELREAVWGVQWLVGIAGIAIAGKETIAVAKQVGWRKVPRALWTLFLHPDADLAA